MTPPSPDNLREAVAALIDPTPWQRLRDPDLGAREYAGRHAGVWPNEDELFRFVDWDQRLTRSLAKADAILSLPALSVPERWQPIETAPRDGTRILLAGGGLERVNVGSWCPHVAAWDAEAEGMFEDGPAFLEGHEDGPTMWMPLPPLSAIPSPGGGGSSRPWPQPVAQATSVPRSLAQGEGDATTPEAGA